MRVILTFIIVCIFAAPLAFPDTIKLKNGKIIEGDIFEKTDEYVRTFDEAESIFVIYYDYEIESVKIDKSLSGKE